MPVTLDLTAPDLGRWLRPGDGIVVGQCCAEPTPLIEAVTAQAPDIPRLSLFAGMTFTDAVGDAAAAGVRVWSYGGLGRTGRIPDLQVVTCHYSALPALFAARRLPGDVALVQVSPPDVSGRCSLGPGVDYLADALRHARVIIAEVNERCPRTSGAWVHIDELDAVLHTRRELVQAPTGVPSPLEERIAVQVASVVHHGDTIQLGIGALPEAILSALRHHRDLGVHTGMISDGIQALIEAGVITNARKPEDRGVTVTGSALGSTALMDALHERDDILFRPVSAGYAPARLAHVGRLAAINSALQIDLDGNAGSEAAGGARIGAVGGQADFLRAAAASGGAPIIALPAARIVRRLDGPVSVTRADVDWVVTEHGARSLRGLTDGARRAAMIELAGSEPSPHGTTA
jgi:acyl-CoA hydrolase